MQNFVNTASSIPVISGAREIKANFAPGGTTVDQTNPLVLNSTRAITNFIQRPSSLTQSQVNTYLASSVLLHNLDGWVYLSSAIDCLLNGDAAIALHLGYYSELRGSMSFLASQGIGIFNNRHINVDRHNAINLNPPIPQYRNGNPVMHGRTHYHRTDFGTHIFTWDSLDHWIKSSVHPVNDEILKVFSVSGKSFDQWADKFPYASTLTANQIIKKWLKLWNADVHFYSNDRDARNNVSYRPQRQRNVPSHFTLNEIIQKLGAFWEILEPDNTNRFMLLDKYLLRIFLQEMYRTLPTTIRSTNTFDSLVKQTLTDLGLSHDVSFINFLTNTSPVLHDLFVEAGKDAIISATGSINPLSVIARATLMLRLSTGTATSTFKLAGVTHSELDFLWDRFGFENGFWETGDYNVAITDIWDDIKDYIDDVITFAQGKAPNLCLNEIYTKRDLPQALTYFKQFHRAGLWGYSL